MVGRWRMGAAGILSALTTTFGSPLPSGTGAAAVADFAAASTFSVDPSAVITQVAAATIAAPVTSPKGMRFLAASSRTRNANVCKGGINAFLYNSPAYLPKGANLKPALGQSDTNGNSWLGTFKAPNLSQWLDTPGQPMPQGTPWGGKTSQNTNYYTDAPTTGMTRFYDFTISRGTIKPDGVEKQGILINGGFPGPTIEANWGDWIQVTVHNQLDTEGTSLHWHGLLQKDTPWMDGVPSVQQCPIAPGSTFTYRFKADLYGTSWYHSHYSAQYAGGALGAMIIHGPSNAQYDEDKGPVILSDWFHDEYLDLVGQVMNSKTGLPPLSNNNLINGKMNYPCANTTNACTPNAGVSKFSFESGKKYLLRLINAGAEGIQKFSIDNHKMTVIANDFVEVQPYETDLVTLGVGQRSNVVVEATGKSGDLVWMRSTLAGGCNANDGVSPEAVAVIYYQNADQNAVPVTNSTIDASRLAECQNDKLTQTVPVYSMAAPNPSSTETIDITFGPNTTDPNTAKNVWFMNKSSFRGDYNDPVLLEAKLGHREFDPEWNVYDFGSNRSVRLVLYNHVPVSHPMHMHGHNMYILDEGYGTYSGSVQGGSNPQRRDVQLLWPAKPDGTPSYMVIQIDLDNPGVWPFHCHIAWHVSAGLYINILERPDDIVNSMNIPGIMAQTCRDWSAFTGNHVPDQIDSGL
ncbi:hypothetical protein H2203_002402 [Taxawa tesnikishii (nom. ined.)]|nr:hypothetical protein H2203_002402 [Dothideales sp. JES 119]